MATVTLKNGREKSLLRRHPWVFSGAIKQVDGEPASGDTVTVRAADGAVLGLGAWSPSSQIQVRMWTFGAGADIDTAWFRGVLGRAIAGRQRLLDGSPAPGVRLVNAEADGLPGLIVDRYADWLVCQFLSAGAEKWRTVIADELAELQSVTGIWERSDVDVRNKEGLPARTGRLWGRTEPPELIEIVEDDSRYLVDIRAGHKTGFYLDQRLSRQAIRPFVHGETLNCFCYSGSFGVVAHRAGASHVIQVDSSADALDLAKRNLAVNGFLDAPGELMEGDVFHVLRRFRDMGRSFDTIILDPPKFAESREKVDGACRGYKDINLLALKLLRPGGTLITFSCSGLVSRELFERTVAFAAADAGRPVQVLRSLEQAEDHPGALQFPEAHYLKGLVCRVAE